MPLTTFFPQYRLLAKSDLVTTGTPATVAPQGNAIFEYAKYLHVEGVTAGGAFTRLRPNATAGAAAHTQCSNMLMEIPTSGTVATNTTATTAGGWAINMTTSAAPKFFSVDILNVPTNAKRMIGLSNYGSITAATVPIVAKISGIWVNTEVIQYLDLYTVTTISGATANTFAGAATATTTTGPLEFHVWGKLDY